MMSAAGETTNDVNVGKVEGAQAATTSITDSTSQNQTGVTEGQTGVVAGQTAKTTSEDDTFVHYGGHVFQVPTGAIETYNSANVFTGYSIGGQTITVAQMMSAAQGSTQTYDDVNLGRVEGTQAATTSNVYSTSQNQTGVVAGQTGSTTSITSSYSPMSTSSE